MRKLDHKKLNICTCSVKLEKISFTQILKYYSAHIFILKIDDKTIFFSLGIYVNIQKFYINSEGEHVLDGRICYWIF
jgi:hypothetical protein